MLGIAAVQAVFAVSCFAAVCTFVPGASEIVVAPDAAPSVRFAASEMHRFMSAALGAEVPVVNAPTSGRTAVVLGVNAWSRAAGLAPEKLPRDGFQIRVAADRVYVAGLDDPRQAIEPLLPLGRAGNLKFEKGTLFGAYEFLERFAGCRFYFPGELGTVVPRLREIRVANAEISSSPWFTVRHYYMRGDGEWPAEADDGYGAGCAENLNWLRTRMQTYRIPCCHGQNGFNITRRFRDTHPEWLQLRKDGMRETNVAASASTDWHYYHLCQSSDVWNQFFRDTVAYFRNGRRIPKGGAGSFQDDYVDVMPQDGFHPCQCSRCLAAYSAEDKVNFAADLVWGRTAAFAKRLADAGYPAIVTQMAYRPYDRVPTFDLPANIRVMVAKKGPWMEANRADVQRQAAEIKAWAEKMGGGRSVWVWTYPGKYGEFAMAGVPQMAPRAYAAYYGRLSPMIFGAFAESESDKTIYNYLNYYVFGKVAWNGRVDVDALLAEHHRLMFGAAAGEMGRFLEALEAKWIGGVMGREGCSVMGPLGPELIPPSQCELWTRIYTPQDIDAWDGLLRQAAGRVPSDSLEARRITMFRREFFEPLAKGQRAFAEAASVPAELARRRASGAPNLLLNGDFASLDGWTASTNGVVALDASTKVTGSASLRLESSDASTEGPFLRACATYRLAQGVERMKPCTRYRISFFVKLKDVRCVRRNAGVSLCFHDNVDRAEPIPFLSGTTDWIHVSAEFTSKRNTNVAGPAFVRPRLTHCSGTAWFDGIRIEELK